MSVADELPQDLYAFAATLAVDRMKGPNKAEHLTFAGRDVEEGERLWGMISGGMKAMVVDRYAEAKLLEGNPISDEDKQEIAFAIGFFLGRAFEEINVLLLNKMEDLNL